MASILRLPSRVNPVWLVYSPIRLSFQRSEILFRQDVQTRKYVRVAHHFAPLTRADDGFVVAGDLHVLRSDTEGRGGDGSDARAEGGQTFSPLRMHAVGQQHHVGLGIRIDP
jgi:hypothetical protein